MTTTETTPTDMTVANEINRQIGHKAFFMIGTRHKLGSADSLTFDIRGSNVANKIMITLTAADLYDMVFYKVRRVDGVPTAKVVAEERGLYADMLHATIERVTGLYTKLF